MLSLLGMWHHGSVPRVAFFASVWKRTKSCTACRSVFCKRCLKFYQKEVYDISYVPRVNPRTTSKAPSTWSSSSTSDAAGFGSREALGLCSARQGSFPGGWSSAEGRWASRPLARRGSGTHAKDQHHPSHDEHVEVYASRVAGKEYMSHAQHTQTYILGMRLCGVLEVRM